MKVSPSRRRKKILIFRDCLELRIKMRKKNTSPKKDARMTVITAAVNVIKEQRPRRNRQSLFSWEENNKVLIMEVKAVIRYIAV